MRKLAILLLPVTAALDGLRITVQSRFASNATAAPQSALDRLARAQRLRDDLTIDEKPTALGGWTVEVVARSTEYEKIEENDEVDDEAAAEISVDSPQLELSEKRIRALPYRVARDVKRHDDPLKRWRILTEDFPAYRKGLAGPMPKNHGEKLVEGWAMPATDHLWVCGTDVVVRKHAPYDVVRDAFRAVDVHETRVAELDQVGLSLDELAAKPKPPARLVPVNALDGGVAQR